MKTKHYVVEQKFGMPYQWREVGRWPFEEGPERPNKFFDDTLSLGGYETRLLVVEVEQIRGSGPDAWPQPSPPPTTGCVCPDTCDCESPDTEPARCSNNCPEHNITPLPVSGCTAPEHRNGAR
jgi:hypothetical protein